MYFIFNLIYTDKFKRILVASICIALASQVNIPWYTDGFILTLSIIFLPIFLYFNDDINPIAIALGIAIASPLFRGILLIITKNADYITIGQYILTDVFFYLCYGLLYFLLYWHRTYRNNGTFFFTIVLCDYLANLVEISLLLHFSNYTLEIFRFLFLTSFVRSLSSCSIAFIYHYFNLMIRKEAHEKRYFYFLWSASAVKSEVYFMKKNIEEIERITKNAYLLNKKFESEQDFNQESLVALNIARDVHEIKKDYQNVIIGLGSYFEEEDNNNMKLSEIIKIVLLYSRNLIRLRKLDILITCKTQLDLPVKNHYYLVSVLSNIITNSIDAIDIQRQGEINISIIESGDMVAINIKDNGPGIPEEFHELVFRPGFSTKFDKKTGDIYRGIGLSHVKIIIQEQFNGEITLCNSNNKGADFLLLLNKNKLMLGEQL